MPKITVIGDVTIDNFITIPQEYVETECRINDQQSELILPYGGKIPVEDVVVKCGGNAANVAVGLKRLGIELEAIIPIGIDMFSNFAMKNLEQENIIIDERNINENFKLNTSYILRYNGERTILSHHVKKDYFIGENFDTEFVFFSSHDGDNNVVSTKLLVNAEINKCKIIFSPGNTQIKGDPKMLEAIIAKSFLTICNKSEAYEILKIIDRADLDVINMLHRFNHMGSHHVVITDGANGVNFFNGNTGETGHLNSLISPNEIVDTTGAGDAMTTSVTFGLISGWNIEKGCTFGLKNSASVLRAIGAQTGLLRNIE